ncbi:hypothetical protein OAP14_09720, partial [Aliiglaciecola sp.]|nr:hypothetical protein [Aliiglaciecola sp.]
MKHFLLVIFFISFGAFCDQLSHDSFTVSSFSFQEPWEHYKASVFRDGTTVLIIENDAQVSRTYRIENTSETFVEVLRLLDDYQFTKFSNSYGMNPDGKDPQCKEQWSHSGYSVLTLQYAGQHKTVRIDHGCKGFKREDEFKNLS